MATNDAYFRCKQIGFHADGMEDTLPAVVKSFHNVNVRLQDAGFNEQVQHVG
ncbi:MAG: hypothetical protein HYR77_07430 [Ignavibacteria bacterium]|nr:hypothetical protein [Ignavibacteria bacterium]